MFREPSQNTDVRPIGHIKVEETQHLLFRDHLGGTLPSWASSTNSHVLMTRCQEKFLGPDKWKHLKNGDISVGSRFCQRICSCRRDQAAISSYEKANLDQLLHWKCFSWHLHWTDCPVKSEAQSHISGYLCGFTPPSSCRANDGYARLFKDYLTSWEILVSTWPGPEEPFI